MTHVDVSLLCLSSDKVKLAVRQSSFYSTISFSLGLQPIQRPASVRSRRDNDGTFVCRTSKCYKVLAFFSYHHVSPFFFNDGTFVCRTSKCYKVLALCCYCVANVLLMCC